MGKILGHPGIHDDRCGLGSNGSTEVVIVRAEGLTRRLWSDDQEPQDLVSRHHRGRNAHASISQFIQEIRACFPKGSGPGYLDIDRFWMLGHIVEQSVVDVKHLLVRSEPNPIGQPKQCLVALQEEDASLQNGRK